MKRASCIGAGAAALAVWAGLRAAWEIRSNLGARSPAAVGAAPPAERIDRARRAVEAPPAASSSPAPASSKADDRPVTLDFRRPVRPEDLEPGPSDDEIRAEEERVAEREAERVRALAQARPAIDPRELGFEDEAGMHDAWRKRLGIPADRAIRMQRGERDGRPVIDVLVPPRSVAE